MAFLPVAMTIAAAVTQAAGAYGQGKAAADASRTNADIARMEGLEKQKEFARQETLSREKSARLMSEQRARYGASGTTFEGSPLEVMADQAFQSEMDALAIRHQGKLERWKANTTAENLDWQAGNYETAGKIAAGSTLLTSAGKMFMGGTGTNGKKDPLSLEDERDEYFRKHGWR